MCNIARIMQTNPVIRKSSKRNNDSKYSKYEETIQVDKVFFFLILWASGSLSSVLPSMDIVMSRWKIPNNKFL